MFNNRELILLDPRRRTAQIEEVHVPNQPLVEYRNELKIEHRYPPLDNVAEVTNLVKGKSLCSITPRDKDNYMEWCMTNVFHQLKDNIFKPSNNTYLNLTITDNVTTNILDKIGVNSEKS